MCPEVCKGVGEAMRKEGWYSELRGAWRQTLAHLVLTCSVMMFWVVRRWRESGLGGLVNASATFSLDVRH